MNVVIIFYFVIQAGVCQYDRRVITSLKYSKYSHNRVAPSIVHGEPADTVQVPYLVSLKQPDDVNSHAPTLWRNLCGGTIIDPNRVLTAAHCFELNDFYFAKHPSILRYVAGNIANTIKHTGRTESTPEGQWRTLIRVLIHKKFVFPMNDIALVYVNLPWIFTNNVRPIRLARRTVDYKEHCTAAGYGRLGPTLRDAISPVLLVAPITVLPRLQCSAFWDMNMNSFICTDTHVTDVARGDSGGPLVCNSTSDPEEKFNESILVGVVSGKSVDRTSLFTRISAYRSWIDNNNGNKLFVNPCLVIIPFILIYTWFYFLFVYLINR